LKAIIAAACGLIQASEIFLSTTAWISRKPSAANESVTPFSLCARVVVSASVSE
jgi:hypothetical protein